MLLFFQQVFASTPEEMQWIAERIFHNECGSNSDKLVWWNEGESFASLGIGHFIWYPDGERGPFEESFPRLVLFVEAQGVKVPKWMRGSCPWLSRAEFLSADAAKHREKAKRWLLDALPLQVAFLFQNFEAVLPQLLSEDAKPKIDALLATKQGRYALVDYLNFKGKGTSPQERYAGRGWGLKQVLEEMPTNSPHPVAAFVRGAKEVLQRRVANAPPEREEERWLKGWLSRVDSYKVGTD